MTSQPNHMSTSKSTHKVVTDEVRTVTDTCDTCSEDANDWEMVETPLSEYLEQDPQLGEWRAPLRADDIIDDYFHKTPHTQHTEITPQEKLEVASRDAHETTAHTEITEVASREKNKEPTSPGRFGLQRVSSAAKLRDVLSLNGLATLRRRYGMLEVSTDSAQANAGLSRVQRASRPVCGGKYKHD